MERSTLFNRKIIIGEPLSYRAIAGGKNVAVKNRVLYVYPPWNEPVCYVRDLPKLRKARMILLAFRSEGITSPVRNLSGSVSREAAGEIQMSPTVFREKGFRFFFLSRKEPRMHIHVQSGKGEAEFRLEPHIELAVNYCLRQDQMGIIEQLIKEHRDEIQDAWKRHFGR